MVVLPETTAVGGGATFTVVTALFVQPLPLVTVTVYEVGEVGFTVIVVAVEPEFQEYVPPPEAVRVAELPVQIFVFPEIEAVGRGLELTVAAAVSEHPPAETITE